MSIESVVCCQKSLRGADNASEGVRMCVCVCVCVSVCD